MDTQTNANNVNTELEHAPLIRWPRVSAIVGFSFLLGAGACLALDARQGESHLAILSAKTRSITAPRAALIQSLGVKVGDEIAAGQHLLTLKDEQLGHQLQTQQRLIDELAADLERVRAAAELELAWRKRDLQAEIFHTQLKTANLHQDKVSKEVEHLAWKERLSNPKTAAIEISSSDRSRRSDETRLTAMLRADAAAAAVESIGTQLALCDTRLSDLQGALTALELQVRSSSGVEVAAARLQRARGELAALEATAAALNIESPVAGVVSTVERRIGEHVEPGVTVVELVDVDRLSLLAPIPLNELAQWSVGSRVVVRFPNGDLRTGLVAEVAPTVSTEAMGATQGSHVTVRIEPHGKPWPVLPTGSAVHVKRKL